MVPIAGARSAPREEAGEVRAGRPDPRRGRRRARARSAGPDAICVEEEAGEGARSQEAGRKREGRMSHQNDVPSLVFLVVVGD